MHTHRCLVSIAELELNALLQDTRIALDGLQCQRESVTRALEMAQYANERSDQPRDETDAQVASLQDRLHHLNAALDLLKREIELLEEMSVPPDTEPFIVLPLPIAQAPNDNRSLVETINPRPTPCPTC